ncbi:MAG: HAMP domain-containing sensor histidine kinase [Myxococcales bacterium]
MEGPLELQTIAEDFNEMAEALSQQQQRQLAYLGGVVHDLRNPLSALQLSAARLDPERGRLTDQQARSTLALVRRQIDLLNRMTGDLLDAARIRRGQLELRMQERDVRELARGAFDLFRSAATTHRLVLEVTDEPAMVSCDPLRIEQVLNNLISNATKYSPNGGDVLVDVAVSGDEAVLSVTDEGVGIAPEDVSHIFEPFRRAGASRESVRGVGLGLYVTQQIVQAHGGRIEVDSTPGAGSTFRVLLPLSRLARREPVAQPRPEPPGASP